MAQIDLIPVDRLAQVQAELDSLKSQIVELTDKLSKTVSPGTIITSVATAMNGYFLCDGAAYSRTTYADLFKVIGTTYGSGNGVSTFNVPNFKDRFLQMVGDKTVIGQMIEPGLPNITHIHTGTSDGAGSHSHTRGTMNITGNFFVGNIQYQNGNEYGGSVDGAFTRTNGNGVQGASWTARGTTYNLNASKSWTGSTSEASNHTHVFTTGNNSDVNTIYGASSTVQPKSSIVNYFIKF